MHSIAAGAAWVALGVFLAPLSFAATITGSVTGPEGQPFPGAFIAAQNKVTKITVDVLSGKDGRYRIEKLAAGNYDVRLRAIGYKADARTGLALTADQKASQDFALQKGMVRWSDLTLWQGIKLLPEAKGKQDLVRECTGCHGFESRMAAVQRDEDGWRDRVNYMRNTMFVRTTDAQADDIVSYLTTMFGPDSTALPKSPADLPAYKDYELHFSDAAMKIVYVEYDLPGPGRFPWDPNPDKDGNVWVPYMSQLNEVAKLDPATGRVDEYKIPDHPRVGIHSAVPAPDGSVWFTEQNFNRLGHIDPQTREVTEYPDVPVPADMVGSLGGAPSKHTVRVDPRGIVWSSGHPFTSFDPKTKKFTEYSDPGNVYGLALDKDGSHVWYDGFTPDGKIYERDTKTGELVGSWQPPTRGLPRRIQVDNDGVVWFAEYRAGKIGRFDPKTQTFKEFQLPMQDSTPYALALDKEGGVWYSADLPDVIGRLDPNTGKTVIYPFPHLENTMREFYYDSQGRMWWTSPANNKVGYFYLTENTEHATK
jgi:virginiamycin B lyase